jgi:hypothetical protein
MLTLTVRPRLERGGYHLDRFDAYLGDDQLVTSRPPLLDGARRLLEQGHDPETPLTIRRDGKDHDSFAPRSLGELARWTYEETSAGGIKRRRWQPFNLSMPLGWGTVAQEWPTRRSPARWGPGGASGATEAIQERSPPQIRTDALEH